MTLADDPKDPNTYPDLRDFIARETRVPRSPALVSPRREVRDPFPDAADDVWGDADISDWID